MKIDCHSFPNKYPQLCAMEMYAQPIVGTYDYKMPNFDGTFRSYLMKVEVLGESAKRYLIKLLCPINGHRPHDTIKVMKHNVKLFTEPRVDSTNTQRIN